MMIKEVIKDALSMFALVGLMYVSGLVIGTGIMHAVDGHIVMVNYYGDTDEMEVLE